MRRLAGLAAALLCAGCAEQSVADPCTIRVDVSDVPNLQINTTRNIDVDVIVRSGNCTNTDKDLSWMSTRPQIAELTSTNNSGATVFAKQPGSTTIVAWLTRGPSTRDSISVNVVAPTDN